MIPKIIHYCWFGNSKIPVNVQKYIDTWRKLLPDFEIIEWNESKFDVDSLEYTRQAYQYGKYAFVSDYVRLYALEKYGGIYFDIDIQVIKDFDSLLQNDALFCFECNEKVMTAFMACKPHHPIIQEFLLSYRDKSFNIDKLVPNTEILTDVLKKNGLTVNGKTQKLERNVIVYSKEFFSGYDMSDASPCVNENTYTVHHYLGSWCSKKEKIGFKLKKIVRKLFGKNIYHLMKRVKKKIVG